MKKWSLLIRFMLVMSLLSTGGLIVYNYQNDIIKVLRHNDKIEKEGIDIVKTDEGKNVSSTGTIYLDRDDLRESSDTVILGMLHDFDLKVREVEHLIHTKSQIKYIFDTKIIHDTIIITEHDTIRLSDYDTWTNGYLTLDRYVYTDSPDTAHYKYSHLSDISCGISTYKEGTWKLKNIFIWRDKLYKASVVSSDTNLVFTEIDSYYIGKIK